VSTVASSASVRGSHSGETAARIRQSLQLTSGNSFDTHRASKGVNCHKPEGTFYMFRNVAGCLGKKYTGGRKFDCDEDLCLAPMEAN
jgi:aspartate/methionine/tyrosine aminotransferase